MIKIDDKFLNEVGLAEMPEEQKQAFLQHTQEELEMRVGEEMSRGMTVQQLEEFEGIMNQNREVMIRLLMQMDDYRQDPLYKKLLEKYNVTEGTMEILSEFLSVKWIQKNRPDYEKVAIDVLEDLKTEIADNRESILAS